jgi:phospholipase/carboxylesterase
VPVQNETELLALRDWTLRVRPATESPIRLLILIHGWTGDENSMWVFVRNFPARFWIVAPRAPYSAATGGYSWRSGLHDRPTFENLRPAAESLLQFVDDYASQNHLDAGQFDVMGFSQGAAMVNCLALLHPDRVHRAGVLAGFVPEGSEQLLATRPLKSKPFFVAHGTQDELVSVDVARRSVSLLEQAGADVSYCEDEVGHKLSAGCLRALQAFFS